MDLTQLVLLGAVIAGVNEVLVRARAKDFWVVTSILTSALIGAAFGYFGVEGLTVVTGLAAGFGASGAMKTLSTFGNKSTPQPSGVLSKEIK